MATYQSADPNVSYTSNGDGTFTYNDNLGRTINNIGYAGLPSEVQSQVTPTEREQSQARGVMQTSDSVNGTATSVTTTNKQPSYLVDNGIRYTTFADPYSQPFQSAAGSPGAGSSYTPSMSSIGSTITAPSGAGGPTLPTGTAGNAADTFNTSLAATLQSQQASLSAALKARTDSYQQQINSLNEQKASDQQMQELGLGNMGSVTAEETAAKEAALKEEQAQFEENYTARQKLTDQLQTLLSTGQSIIEGMKSTTGLSSIMNPRISQTMADVQGQAGVISASLAAYDSQIGIAQNQLKSATDAISSIYGDQLNYWKSIVSFYSDNEKTTDAAIAKLTDDQKGYIDEQIKTLETNLTNTQSTVKLIQTAMLDPKTALTYAKAGVSLTDTPDQIAYKLGMQAKAEGAVWSAPHVIGTHWVQQNTQTGEIKVLDTTGAASGTAGQTATDIGKGLADAHDAIAHGADPSAVKQAFLKDHPKAGASWDKYFTDSAGNKNSYPTAPAPAKKPGLFGWGFMGL